MTDRDPDATARMPLPGDSDTPPTNPEPGPERPVPSPAGTTVPPPPVAPAAPQAPDASVAPVASTSRPVAPSPPVEGQPSWTAPSTVAGKTRRTKASRDDRTASVLIGLVMLAIGLWFFAEQTLGLDLPRIRWSSLWPLILIGIGVWIVLGSMRRNSR